MTVTRFSWIGSSRSRLRLGPWISFHNLSWAPSDHFHCGKYLKIFNKDGYLWFTYSRKITKIFHFVQFEFCRRQLVGLGLGVRYPNRGFFISSTMLIDCILFFDPLTKARSESFSLLRTSGYYSRDTASETSFVSWLTWFGVDGKFLLVDSNFLDCLLLVTWIL